MLYFCEFYILFLGHPILQRLFPQCPWRVGIRQRMGQGRAGIDFPHLDDHFVVKRAIRIANGSIWRTALLPVSGKQSDG
jgi:hypothetical protein